MVTDRHRSTRFSSSGKIRSSPTFRIRLNSASRSAPDFSVTTENVSKESRHSDRHRTPAVQHRRRRRSPEQEGPDARAAHSPGRTVRARDRSATESVRSARRIDRLPAAHRQGGGDDLRAALQVVRIAALPVAMRFKLAFSSVCVSMPRAGKPSYVPSSISANTCATMGDGTM